MPYEYNNIVHQYFEELKPLFVNYLRKNFQISYDDIMDIYSNVWVSVHNNIRNGTVKNKINWKAYILKIGWREADKTATRRPRISSIDDEIFNRQQFEIEYFKMKDSEKSIYDDPDLQAVLASELSYIPDPCNKILRLFYFENLSMSDIAATMNYSNARNAITVKNRCKDRLKKRVVDAARRLGILN